MMTLGDGVCSDETVTIGHPYLGKLSDDRYFVLVPIDPKGTTRQEIPYMEAAYIDPLDKELYLFAKTHPDLAPIF